MIFSLILGVALGAAAVIFILQNVAIVDVAFFAWHFQGSLALVLLMTVLLGILITLLLVLPETVGNYFRFRSLQKENVRLAEDLRKQKELTVFAKQTPATTAELEHIDRGAITKQ
jgi:uncharacterized integral membrane protein